MKWEYKTESLDHFQSSGHGSTVEEQLNSYGNEGWELVTMIRGETATVGNPPRINGSTLIFKRSK